MKYSNDEERAAARKAAKHKYYLKNKDKHRRWAMEWRHRNDPIRQRHSSTSCAPLEIRSALRCQTINS